MTMQVGTSNLDQPIKKAPKSLLSLLYTSTRIVMVPFAIYGIYKTIHILNDKRQLKKEQDLLAQRIQKLEDKMVLARDQSSRNDAGKLIP